MTDAPPSDRARALLRGAYDTHMHIAPDVVERKIDDISLARRFAELGMAGFVLKSHYGSTAERASVVRGSRARRRRARRDQPEPGRRRDEPAGGRDRRARGRADRLVPDRRLGQRVPRARGAARRARRCRSGSSSSSSSRDQGIEIDPVPVVDDSGAVLPETREVLKMIARHRMVLATGHLSRDEIFTVVDAARRATVSRRSSSPIPSSPRRTSASRTSGRSRRAARCSSAASRRPHTGKVEWEQWLENIRATGPEHSRALDRSRPGVQPAGGGRDGADGRPAARRRASPSRRCTRWRSSTRGGSRERRRCERRTDDGDRRALRRLRLARGRRDRGHDHSTAGRPA